MRRRIVRTTIAVTALAVIGLAVPLAVAVAVVYRDETVQRLIDDATRAGTAVPGPPLSPADPVEVPATDDGASIAVYAPDGARVSGAGPARADAVTTQALRGVVATASGANEVTVAVPVGAQEQVVAAVRAALPQSAIDDRVHGTWLVMAALGLAALGGAALVAAWQARRISRPLEALTAVAGRLGDGDFTARVGASGVTEIDTVGAAMNGTAERLAAVLERERAFSADASHQLRTPLTALRIQLESAAMGPAGRQRQAIEAALEEIDRLDDSVETLLRLARDIPADRSPLDLAGLLSDAEADWRGRLADQRRSLELAAPLGLPPIAVSASAVRHILDVLVDNAVRHGQGTVRVDAHEVAGGVAIDVSDEGPPLGHDAETLFARRQSMRAGSGIGLALARSLAEAEGGRLLLAAAEPHPVFRLVLAGSGAAPVA